MRNPIAAFAISAPLVLIAGRGVLLRSIPVGPGAPMFEQVQPAVFAAGASLTNAWADYDGDGDPDLFVGFNGTPNRLYRNDGGRFTDAAAAAGVADARATRAVAWGDIDSDGDPDLIVGFTPAGGGVLRLYRNDRGHFEDATSDWQLTADSGAVRQISVIDADADGRMDVFVAFRDRPNALYRNEGSRFTDVAATIGIADARRTVGAVWFDADQDGDLDLYVGNMDGDANGFFRNDGGRFADVAAELGLEWGGRTAGDAGNGTVRPCAADVDNDGRIDLFMANYGRNGLFLNRGGRFEDVSAAWGVDIDARYDSCAFADYDNDGRIDLYVNGTVTGGVSYPDHLYRNDGNRFVETTPPELAALDGDHGVQWVDFDADGDVDLALTASNARSPHPLLRNLLDAPARARSLTVLPADSAGRPLPAGTEVRLYEAGTQRVLGTRLVDSGSGYNSQNVVPVHFGLGGSGSVDVEVTVPAGGQRLTGKVSGIELGRQNGRPLVVRLTRAGRASAGR